MSLILIYKGHLRVFYQQNSHLKAFSSNSASHNSSFQAHLRPAVPGKISRFLYDFTSNAVTKKTQQPSGREKHEAWRAERISSVEIFHFLAVIFGVKPTASPVCHFVG